MSSAFRHRASLALNVVLSVTVAALALHQFNRASAPSSIRASPGETTNEVSPLKVANEPPVFIEPPQLQQYTDVTAASDRRRLVVDQLRAMGVPNEILGRVARVDFEVQWDSRFEACQGDMDKLAGVQLEMNESKDAEMRAALGEEDFKQWDQNYMLWEAMSTKVEASPAEAEALYGFKKKLQQRMLELDKARLKGTMDDAEINAAVDEAYSDFNQKMRDLLGVERYAKSQQMDDDFITDNFRHQLSKANPTDAQFQELFKVEKEWHKARMEVEQQFQNNTFSPDYQEKLRALDAARDQEYQRVLGADVFNDYRKQQDPLYSQMRKYESLWGLDGDKMDYVYDTMKQYQKNVEDYQAQVLSLQARGQEVDWEAVNKNLQQSASQTQQALQNRLGRDSFTRLQRNHVLRWATLTSQPPRTPP